MNSTQVAVNTYSLPPGFRELPLRLQSDQPILVTTIQSNITVVAFGTICSVIVHIFV